MLLPIGTGKNRFCDPNLSCTAGSVYHLSVSEIDSDMSYRHAASLKYHNIPAFEFSPSGDSLILGAGPPGNTGHISLFYAGLVQTPVHKAGTVESIRAFRTAYIWTSQFAFGNFNQLFDLCRRCIRCCSRFGSRLGGWFRSRFAAGLACCFRCSLASGFACCRWFLRSCNY